MNWKEFFKFSGWKLLIVILFFSFSFLISFFIFFAAMDVTSNASRTLSILHYTIAPLALVPILGELLNILYYYWLACMFIYIIKHPKARKPLILQGIAIIILLIIFGQASYYYWQKSYIKQININSTSIK